jgi:hypothetical protein
MPERNDAKPIGVYANFLVVGHNAFEFVLDFGQAYESSEGEQIHTRIATTPMYAKAMLVALRTALERYEAAHGYVLQAKERTQ